RTHGQRVFLLARENGDTADLGEVDGEVGATGFARLFANVGVLGVDQNVDGLVGKALLMLLTRHSRALPRSSPPRARCVGAAEACRADCKRARRGESRSADGAWLRVRCALPTRCAGR